MTVRELRDPSQPCEHTLDPLGMYDGAYFDEDGQFWRCDHNGMCPGGKLVRLRPVNAFEAGTRHRTERRGLWEIVEADDE